MQLLIDQLHPLVDACLAGDEQAAAELVRRYQHRVFGLCWRMLGHRQDAEDAAQETFVRALRALDRWDRNRPMEPWLLAIAANRCRTTLARRTRRPAELPLLEQDATDSLDELNAAGQLAEEVNRALERIRADYAAAFRLFHSEEQSYAQIAEALSCPLGTVKTWVHRARQAIVAQLVERGIVNEHDHGLSRRNRTTQRAAG